MNYKNIVTKSMVLLALLGYVACSFYIIWQQFCISDPKDANQTIGFFASVFTGLVGGIVATALGVKPADVKPPTMQEKLGTLLTSSDKNRELYGMLYTLAYIFIGAITCVVWACKDQDALEVIRNNGSAFLGMMIAVATAYFNEKNN